MQKYKDFFRNRLSLLKLTLIVYALHHFFISMVDLVTVSVNLIASNEILSPGIQKNEAQLGQFDCFFYHIIGRLRLKSRQVHVFVEL